ncbi:MAG: peptidoglycan-binding domain-containing protein [Archangium sp.]|nr:peptidoglycan-binding domain-containing protein [Archangium sp.]MDP3152289.1 peptidoglycan-binding domain-containing protein [Archangium sp.]MDP3570685.1 peptidoglycan-binding domain-containing protein [Archangium sp.]
MALSINTNSRGSDVTRLQQALTTRGFNPRGVDGAFGNNTRAAVIAFQRAQGITADGIVGPDTSQRLFGSREAKYFDGVSDFNGVPANPGNVNAGRGWGGSEGVADAAKSVARSMGIPVTSEKRNLAETHRVGSTTGSDHYTGNTNAYATDFGVSGARGDDLARRLADTYGIPRSSIGTYNRHTITVDGQRYSVQLLWKVSGHYDHVHLGIRRA